MRGIGSKMERVFTGLLDRNLNKIYEGDMLWIGMRRGDDTGWTCDRVGRRNRRGLSWFTRVTEWILVSPYGETMQMQNDQELRDLRKVPDTSEGG